MWLQPEMEEAEAEVQVVTSSLYCTVLYCTVLYSTVLYCTVLYCTALPRFPALTCRGPHHEGLLSPVAGTAAA